MAEDNLQSRLSDLALSPEEFLDSLPAAVKARAETLERLQSRRERLERNYLRERLLLEDKYEKLYAPLYEERSAIVTGAKDAADPKGVPCFWLTALMRCDAIREGMNEKDPDVMRYLTDLTVEKFGPPPKPAKTAEEVAKAAEEGAPDSDEDEEEEEEEPAGFRLRFAFDAANNPYFTNAELVKTYWIEDDGYGEPVLQKAEGTPIDWKAGKNVTVKVMKKKPRRGAPPTAKPQTKTEPVPSFFNFFSPPEIPQTAEAVAELDEEAIDELREEVEADFEIGMVLRDELVPDAYRWFSGEAAEEEDEDEDDEDDEDEDDDDDDDEDDEDDDSEEEEDSDDDGAGKKKKKAGGKKAAGPPLGPDGKPQECKQQ